jgi:ABC-type transport system involved in multi-copper enzyme maturation permease subunit
MIFSPVISRELAVAARRRETFTNRLAAAGVAMLILGWMAGIAVAHLPLADQGREIFGTLAGLAFGYALIIGAKVTADCVSEEKREGTLGLLFLTDLKGWDVILGKVVASSLQAVYGLIAVLPMLALAMLIGGISLQELTLVSVVLLNAIFLSLSTGIFVSTFSLRERSAMAATIGIIAGITFLPYLAGYHFVYNRDSISFDPAFLTPSPLYAFNLSRSLAGRWGILSGTLVDSLLTSHVLAWMFLVIASIGLPRVAHEAVRGRFRMWWLRWSQRWIYGKEQRRRQIRGALLDKNAYFWLAGRDHLKSKYIWIFLLSGIAMWGFGYREFPDVMLDWFPSAVAVVIVHTFLKIWFASEVCARITEDHRSGALELLLSSPLSVAELLRGQMQALARMFLKPVVIVLALDCLLLHFGLSSFHYAAEARSIQLVFWAAIVMLLLDFYALRWVCAWQSLFARSASRALLASAGRILFLPSFVFWGIIITIGFGTRAGVMPDLSLQNMTLGWFFLGLSADVGFGLRARRRFLTEFRSIASLPAEHSGAPAKQVARVIRSDATLRWSWRRTTAAFSAVVMVYTISICWRKHVLHQELEARLSALRKAGMPTTFYELQASLDSSPIQENGAFALREAMQIIGKKELPTTKILGEGKTVGAKELREFAEILQAEQSVLALARQGLAKSQKRFISDYTPGPALLLPHLAGLGRLSALFQIEAIVASSKSQTNEALTAVLNLVALARTLENEPIIVSQITRYNLLNRAVKSIEKLLCDQELTKEQLGMLQQQLAEAEAADANVFRTAVGFQQIMATHAFEMSKQELAFYLGEGGPRNPMNLLSAGLSLLDLTTVPERDRLALLNGMDAYMDSMRLPFPEKAIKLENLERENGARMSEHPAFIFCKLFLPSLKGAIVQEQLAMANLKMAQLGLQAAIRRAHSGQWPVNLKELPSAPETGFNLGQWTYARTENGITIRLLNAATSKRAKPIATFTISRSSTDGD